MSNLFQDKNTGKLVEFINKHDKEYAMVRDAGGNITYVNIESLVPYDKEKGRLSKVTAPQVAPEPEEKLPESVVPVEDTSLNLNTEPAEQMLNACWCWMHCPKRLSSCVCPCPESGCKSQATVSPVLTGNS